MSSSNCCFLTCIQVCQEAGQVVWYSHLFQNFPQFIVIHTVKGFGIVNKAEIDVFLELFLPFPWSSRCWQFGLWFLSSAYQKVTLSPTFQLWYDPMICLGQYHAAEVKCQSWALASKHLEHHFFCSWTPAICTKISPVRWLNTIRRAETNLSPQTNIQLTPQELNSLANLQLTMRNHPTSELPKWVQPNCL